MSEMYPTKKEIKEHFISTIKEYLIHFKHLLIHPWHRDNGKEYICLICASNDTKKLRKHNKKADRRYHNLSKNWLQNDFINMLRAHHPIEENKNTT